MLYLAVKLIDGLEEGVDIFPRRVGRNVTAGGNDEIGIFRAGIEESLRFGFYGFGCAEAENACGVYVTHGDGICGELFDHGLHVDGVTEMVSRGAGRENGVRHGKHVAAAVVVDDEEVVILKSIHDFFDVRSRKFLFQRGREQAGYRLRHNDSVRASGLISASVSDEEFGRLFENGVYHVGIVVAIHHDLGNVEQSRAEREGTDHAREYGTVGNDLQCLFDCFDINARARRADLGNGEILGILEENGRGQLIFTSHNLRPLEMIDRKDIIFTTTNPNNRYIRLSSSKGNLRDQYIRSIHVGGQKEELYDYSNPLEIARAFRLAGKEVRADLERM